MENSQIVNFREDVYFYTHTKENLVTFEELKKEILIGHHEIEQSKLTFLGDLRKEFLLSRTNPQ